jgi:hypothetical protein
MDLSSYNKNSYIHFVDSRHLYPVNSLRGVITTYQSIISLQLVLLYYNLSTVSTIGVKHLSYKGLGL